MRHASPNRLTEIGWDPDLILSSDSQRTRETYDAMCAGFENEVPVQFHRSMYHAGLSGDSFTRRRVCPMMSIR